MKKINKLYYYTKSGEKKVNCYIINISKAILSIANIDENDNIKIYVKDNKIIIEKE